MSAVDRLTTLLAISDWRPTRAHIESARNALRDLQAESDNWKRCYMEAQARAAAASCDRVVALSAIKPFAAMAAAGDQRPGDDAVWAGQDGVVLRYGHFRAAAALLSRLLAVKP